VENVNRGAAEVSLCTVHVESEAFLLVKKRGACHEKTPMPSLRDRRSFLRLAGLTQIATLASSHALNPIQRVGGPYLKPGLNVYSFLELLKANAEDPAKGIDLFGACDFAAKANFDAVDLTGYFSRVIRRHRATLT